MFKYYLNNNEDKKYCTIYASASKTDFLRTFTATKKNRLKSLLVMKKTNILNFFLI